MKALSILVTLLAGVSVSAYSELLRGGGYSERRLDGGSCDSSGDCNSHGSCSGGDPTTVELDGSCDCDSSWSGSSCDIEKDVYIQTAVFLPVDVKSVIPCALTMEDVVDDVSTWSNKDMKRDLYDMMEVDCFDGITILEVESKMLDGSSKRYLKGSGSDDGDEYVITGVTIPYTRDSAGADHCSSEVSEAMRHMEKKWGFNRLEDLNGETVMLRPGECEAKIIEKIFRSRTSSKSKSKSRSRN